MAFRIPRGLLPFASWQFLFFLIPFALLVGASFWRLERHELLPDWTLANYAEVFGRPYHLQAWLSSVALTVAVLSTATVLGYGVAYAITMAVSPRWRPVALVLVVAPFWTNYVVRAYAWSLVLAGAGPINWVIRELGLSPTPVQLLYTPLATTIGLVHFLSVLVALFVYTRMESIDRRLFEAAADLGASSWQIFREMVLPLTAEAAKGAAIIVVIFSFADFVSPAVLGGQNPPMFSQLVVDAIMSNTDWPLASAFAMVMLASIVAMTTIVGRLPSPRSIG